MAERSTRHRSGEVITVRLQKYLADCGVASRRSGENLIEGGKVTVNGVVVTELGTRIDPEKSVVRVNNRIVTPAHKGVMLLHKPRGVVSTLSDPEGRPSIAEYITKHYKSYYPVGRLDWESSGLVVLTNDGDLADRLLHPRYRIPRVYHAKVEGIPSQRTLELLRRGIKLSDGPASCEAFIRESTDDSAWVEVRLSEGRNRIVRRMFEQVGHPVSKLTRMSHGPFRLGSLGPAQVKHYTEKEYQKLRRIVLEWDPEAYAESQQKRERTSPRHRSAGRRGGATNERGVPEKRRSTKRPTRRNPEARGNQGRAERSGNSPEVKPRTSSNSPAPRRSERPVRPSSAGSGQSGGAKRRDNPKGSATGRRR
jgi:23S rRNA pseudouridine2605 synthase